MAVGDIMRHGRRLYIIFVLCFTGFLVLSMRVSSENEPPRSLLFDLDVAEGVSRDHLAVDVSGPFPDGSKNESILIWISEYERTAGTEEMLKIMLQNCHEFLEAVDYVEIVVGSSAAWDDWNGSSVLENDPRVKLVFKWWPSSVRRWLPMFHRADFEERLQDFDWFLFTEGDIGFTVRHFRHFRSSLEFFRKSHLLEKRFFPGFVLTEKDRKGRRAKVEAPPHIQHSPVIERAILIDGRPHFVFANPYQALYILPRVLLSQFVGLPSWRNYSWWHHDLIPYETAKNLPNFFGYMEFFAGLGWLFHAPHNFPFNGIFRPLSTIRPDLFLEHLSNNYIGGPSNLTLIENVNRLLNLTDDGDIMPSGSFETDCFPVLYHGTCLECTGTCPWMENDDECFVPFDASDGKNPDWR